MFVKQYCIQEIQTDYHHKQVKNRQITTSQMFQILLNFRPDMLDPEKKKEMMEGIVTEIMARMKAQGMSQEDILATIEKISKQGIEEEE